MIRYIYMFFIGLILAILLGTGVAVFYASPKAPTPPVWFNRVEKVQLTDSERQQENAYARAQQDYERQIGIYNRNVSMITLGFAIVVLVASMLLAERLGVVADGLLLGGVFTLLYGIGRGMASDSNKYRFVVAAVGFIITVVLGYIKFSLRPGRMEPTHGKA